MNCRCREASARRVKEQLAVKRITPQPRLKYFRAALCMEDGDHTDDRARLRVIDEIGETWDARLADGRSEWRKPVWRFLNSFQDRPDGFLKSETHAWTLSFIPTDGLINFRTSLVRNEQGVAHDQPYFWRSSARICSHGTPWLGFFRNSSARRSSSAIISGVSTKSSKFTSSWICSATRRCSSGGKARNCCKTSVALMVDKLARPVALARLRLSPISPMP